MFPKSRSSLTYFMLASLALHGVVMVVKFRPQTQSLFPKKQQTDAIKVTFLPDGAPKTQISTKKQIVQSEDSKSAEKPKDQSYLSDRNRQFDRESLAKNVDIFKKAGLGKGQVTQKAVAVTESAKKIKLSDLGMKADPLEYKPTRAPASVSLKGLVNGDPLSEGLSATNDYVQEVGLGDFTQLNTVEFKFFGFYHRIRQKLEQFWGKSIQEKSHALFRSGRRLPAGQDLITSLRITMNEKGEVIKVKVLGASGVRELDDAATESFNEAGPFPNPPKDLLVNGEAVIEWGFVVKS
jgi:TonB family protein